MLALFSICIYSQTGEFFNKRVKKIDDESKFFKVLESEFLKFEKEGKLVIDSNWKNSKNLRIEKNFHTDNARVACLFLREHKIALYYPKDEKRCIGEIGYEIRLKKTYNIRRKKILIEDDYFYAIIFEYNRKNYFLSFINLVEDKKYDLWDNSTQKRFLSGVKVY